MRLIFALAASILSLGFFANAPALAAEQATKQDAISMARKVVEYYKANGRDKTLAAINEKAPQFLDRDIYVYVLDVNGVALAHGGNVKLVNKPLLQLKDADGKPFVHELVAVLKSGKSGWVDYKWPNPLTKQIEEKTTYVEPHDGIGISVGVYK